MPVKAESEALASYWLQQIEAWQSSGQTQQAYCKAHELSYRTRTSRSKALRRHANGCMALCNGTTMSTVTVLFAT